jgi:hypothetical protein
VSITDLFRTAKEIVEDYYNQIGGRDFVNDEAAKELQKVKTAHARKRGRAPSGAAAAPKGKRGKVEKHPKDTAPPASLNFKVPTGSWEHEATAIEQVEEKDDGTLQVHIVWKGGYRTAHPVEKAYKHCPQKVGLLRRWGG